jgi:DNA-binding NtrC family response regulator
MDRFMRYHWPGNIRELQNVLEQALVLCRSRVIESVELPDTPLGAEEERQKATSIEGPVLEEAPLEEWVKEQERQYIIRRLKAYRGRVGLAAKSCGVGVRTIRRKMRLYGIDKRDFTTTAAPSSPPKPVSNRQTIVRNNLNIVESA